MAARTLTEDETARRDELRGIAVILAMIFNPGERSGPPGPLERFRRLQGLVYGELDYLGDGRKEAAELVGLGPKAIDWARNRAKSTPGPDVDVVQEFIALLGPVVTRLMAMPAAREAVLEPADQKG